MAIWPHFVAMGINGELSPMSKGAKGAPGVASGALVSIVVWFMGAFLWGAMFDNKGGEPFSSTFFGVMFVWPLHLVFIVFGTLAWAKRSGFWSRLLVFVVLLAVSMSLWGLGWSARWWLF